MNQRRKSTFITILLPAVAGAILLLSFSDVWARVGGGQSYGGGRSSGGCSGGGAGAIIWLIIQLARFLIYLTIEYPLVGIPLDILLIVGVVYYFRRKTRSVETEMVSVTPAVSINAEVVDVARAFNHLRRFDPNFSEIIFTDFCYALYGKAHEARGRGVQALDLFSPYLSAEARANLLQRNPQNLREVKGIIVGAMQVTGVQGLDTPTIGVRVSFETNYTEATTNGEMTYYVREYWDLERKRDVLSPTPAQATALHCPRCGAPLQKDTVGACAFCLTKIDSGEFQWYVRNISLVSTEARGPLLTGNVAEVGTDLPSVMQPGFPAVRAAFEQANPNFSWSRF